MSYGNFEVSGKRYDKFLLTAKPNGDINLPVR